MAVLKGGTVYLNCNSTAIVMAVLKGGTVYLNCNSTAVVMAVLKGGTVQFNISHDNQLCADWRERCADSTAGCVVGVMWDCGSG
jgi:formylmethanofuran dehydrogenase subunit C